MTATRTGTRMVQVAILGLAACGAASRRPTPLVRRLASRGIQGSIETCRLQEKGHEEDSPWPICPPLRPAGIRLPRGWLDFC